MSATDEDELIRKLRQIPFNEVLWLFISNWTDIRSSELDQHNFLMEYGWTREEFNHACRVESGKVLNPHM